MLGLFTQPCPHSPQVGGLYNDRFPMRTSAGITLAALICLYGSLQFYSSESAYQRQNQDPYMISAQESRFAAIRSAVPDGAVVGYLTDADPGSTLDGVLLHSAAYALAPRLLDRGLNHEWVVGNFTQPRDFDALARGNGLQLQQDFGNGVILFRRTR
jgi:hypothetical protein